jgi:lysyl-tRNA synthetase class 2
MSQDKSHRKRELCKQRSAFLRTVREHFFEQDFIEVTTPHLVPNPGLEVHLNYFKTEFVPDLGGGRRRTFYLPTSPEYHLKKALGWGLERVFEVTKSFRNGEITTQHEPEFLMLEWYRAPGLLKELASDVERLLNLLSTRWGRAEHLHLADLFQSTCQIDLREMILAKPGSFDDEFSRILVEHIEPVLAKRGLVFLWGFPASQAALAQKSAIDPLFADRFEVYFQGLELANAFQELLDPIEQQQRFESELAVRTQQGRDTPPIDFELLASLKSIRSPAAGIALGLDRLFQALNGASDLASILAFSHTDSI